MGGLAGEEGFPGHLLWLGEAEHVEEGGGDICEDAVFEGVGGGVIGDVDDLDEVGGVGGVW